jgi:hypothetical protein
VADLIKVSELCVYHVFKIIIFSGSKMKKYIYILIALLFVVGVVWLIVTPGNSGKPDKYDDLAKCIKNSGAIFYGAFWCPHCQDQKAEFGRSSQYLPYVECSTPDGQGQNQVCTDAGVKQYPTWTFAPVALTASSTIATTTDILTASSTASTISSTTDIITGKVEITKLAEKTGCVIPE